MRQEIIDRLYASGVFSHLDIHFASFTERLAEGNAPELFFASALVSSYTRQGHICLDLSHMAGKQLIAAEDGEGPVTCPDLDAWQDNLRETAVVGKPGEYKPLILDDRSRLYMYRYWDYQDKLAGLIKALVRGEEDNIDGAVLKDGLGRLFPAEQRRAKIDWQRVAAVTVLIKRFCVISGGPGTGKTTTVAKILALLLEQASTKRLRIALAAPTGKAAARLQETIKLAKQKLNCDGRIKAAIPDEASTIHRLLGSIPGSPYFRHNVKNPLPFDCVVVDEASMVDLALMSKLVQALPEQARLILLGDKDQLASVEAGAVLGDICDTGNARHFSRRFFSEINKLTGDDLSTDMQEQDEHDIQDCIVQLQKSYRFGSESGINAVSHAVNAGEGDLAISLLREGRYADIQWKETPHPNALSRVIKDTVIAGFKDYLEAGDLMEALQLFDRFRVLCALREGPYGVVSLNALVEKILAEEKLIEPGKRYYRGLPVLITRNDYNLGLFNGDIGVVLPDPGANNDLRVFFLAADNMVRRFHPIRLLEHETVYAMTVHKSQGSEFDRALLILPDRESPVLTREVIYTGITRAREMVEIWGTESVFRTAISRRIERTSGLRDALWESSVT